ncbi:unnamed protein product [Effrenium voratum]|nr:unnamed protein product [Effrenium voratum]
MVNLFLWLLFPLALGDEPEKQGQVLVKELVLDSAVVDISYLGHSHECLLLTTKKQRLYSSCDAGQSWKEITDKVDSTPGAQLRAERVIVNPADKAVAVLQAQRMVPDKSAGAVDPAAGSASSWHPYIFITEDSGRSWRKAWGRHHGLHSWISHPTRRAWALVSWWNGACDKAKVKGSEEEKEDPDKDKPCTHRLMLTTDLGKSFLQIAPYVVQFSWGSEKLHQSDRIYYTAYASKTGDQGKLSLWTTEVDFKSVDVNDKGRPSAPVVRLKHGNKFMISNEFILVAKVKSEEKQTVNLMVSSDGATTWKGALLPSGMGELEEKWYTIVDTSEGAVLLHLNSDAEEKDTGRVFVSDSEGYKYSQSLLHNVRSATGEVELDKVVSLNGVYLANVVASADIDPSYEKAKQAAAETMEQDASEGSSVDRRHGRGFSTKPGKSGKEERTIRTVISFDKGGSWRYLKPPRVNSQGQQYACIGKPLQDCALHLHGTSSWDLYAPFYSSGAMVKKKIDPVDGCAYSLAELEAHYARTYKKKDIQKYWETDCTPAPSEASPKVKAKAKAKGEASKPAAKEGEGEAKTKGEEKKAAPVLRRTRSWLKKVCGIALLPCEEQLAPLLEQHAAAEKAEDFARAEAT